jgi:predicted nucleotidyltransferase
MKLMLENLPPGLRPQAEALRQCLEAFDRVMPLQAVYLFGSYARGEEGPDSDVDLCIVSEGAERQLPAAQRLRHVMWDIWPRPAFTLVPITPQRLAEKRARSDPFFGTILNEGRQLASED